MDTLLQDIRFGLRRLIQAPGFTFIAILSLAFGIGANTAIFSLVNTVLFRPLPIANPEQIVSVAPVPPDGGLATFSYPNYVDIRDRNEALAGYIAHRMVPISLSRGGNNERIWGYLASGNYFDVLGVPAARGRTFTQEDDKAPGAHPVAVLSYRCWQNRFGGDEKIVGQEIILNNHKFTVIGVAPEGFFGTEYIFTPEIWTPMKMAQQIEPRSNWLDNRGNGVLFTTGRLKPGISQAQALAALNNIADQLAHEHPQNNEGFKLQLSPPGLILPAIRTPTLAFSGVLMVTVGLVLLIACANLANLLLARATGRKKEIAIRLALGASRFRLIRQLLTESVLLAAVGGAIGLLLAVWLIKFITAFKPQIDIPLTFTLFVDWRVVTFMAGLSIMTGILFGLAPAFQATKPELVSALKDEGSLGGYRRSHLRNFLVVAQVALSLVLLVAAGLVVRSLQQVQLIGPGFETERALSFGVDLGLQGYDRERGQNFYKQVLERARALPGVKSASLTSLLPLSLNYSDTGIYVEGQEQERGRNVAMYASIAPDYFKTMGIRLIAGRDFTDQDQRGKQRVAIVNETIARRFWPGQDAVGKRFSYRSDFSNPIEVVGIAKDGKYFSLGEDPRMFLYAPIAQDYEQNASIVVRTATEPQSMMAALRNEARQLDANLPLFDVKTLDEHMNLSLFPLRVGAGLLSGFGILALALATIGLYGVMAYIVSQRTREIGIRIALGANAADVLKLVVGQGMKLTSIGLALGLIAAIVLTRFMASVLYGIGATDVITFLVVLAMLAGVALLACYLPARRAMRLNPMVALRHD